MSDPLKIGFAIPAYRNAERLALCLASIEQVIGAQYIAQTTIVDDSGDGSVANKLRAQFPNADWIVNEQNQGFGASASKAVMASESEIVVLLNDDTQLLELPIEALLGFFADASTFAVSFQSVGSEGKIREGAKRLVWRRGFAKILHNPRDQRQTQHGKQPSDYAVGGHCAFRRGYFADLAGFDSRYEPFYWEDVDLAQRARQRGLRIWYAPDCKVKHTETGAIKSSRTLDYIREITLRNRLVFSLRFSGKFQRILLHLQLGIRAMFSGGRFRAIRREALKLSSLNKHEVRT